MDADMLDLCAIGVVTAAALISSAEKNDGKQPKWVLCMTETVLESVYWFHQL